MKDKKQLKKLRKRAEKDYTVRLEHRIDSRAVIVYGEADANNAPHGYSKVVKLYTFNRHQDWHVTTRYEGNLTGPALLIFNSHLDNFNI